MQNKKDILFVMNNLNVGGAEKALVSMLQVFDYEKYNVDLLLFKKEGLFLKQIPEEVNLLPEPENFKYFDMPFSQVVKENIFRNWNVILRRIQFKLLSRKAKSPAEAEQFGWKPLSKTLKLLPKKYHTAIGFLEKNPNYYVVDKVSASKKIGYIHSRYDELQMNSNFDKEYFKAFNKIITVSDDSMQNLKERFPNFSCKFSIICNINSSNSICEFALKPIPEEMPDNLVISIGRLTQLKNYSLGIESFEILKNRKVPFVWYILGDGELKNDLLEKIRSAGIEDKIIILGVKENPYPYILRSEIFLHTSLFEGDGLVVREAKILNKPIILTNFNTAKSHIENNVNGIIVDFNAVELANSLEKLLKDKKLQENFSDSLSKEDWGTESEIEKLYHILES